MSASSLLATEVRYVGVDGAPVVTTLSRADDDAVLHGWPVRRVSSRRGQRNYAGLFWSATTGAHVSYESRLELDRLWLADFDREIDWISSQPLWFCGGDGATLRRHVPDLMLRRRGRIVVVDVKPVQFVERPEVAAVFAWTGKLCAEKGWDYEVWSGADPAVLANVRFLGLGRRTAFVDRAAVTALLAVGRTGTSVGEVLQAATSPLMPEAIVRPALWSLLWSGEWSTDLGVPLSNESTLTVGAGR